VVVLLAYLALAFKTWMLVDALRRGVSALWYLVVVLPAGDVVYFFAVKLRDVELVRPHVPAMPEDLDLGPTLDQLEDAAAESPSFHNRAALAWALYEHAESARARELFELCLKSHAKDRDAAYGLGLCLIELGDFDGAIAVLGRLVERSFAYDDYAVAEALAEALLRGGHADEACALHEDIATATHRMEHRVAQAKALIRCKQREHARDVLVHAISAFEAQDDDDRRREGADATEARRLLRTLAPPTA
jgi:hypothetical protein